jgi:hypothetical protein
VARVGSVSESVTTGYRASCEHCGDGVEVVVVPKDGEAFVVPRSAMDQLVHLASRLDRMNAKMIYIQRKRAGVADSDRKEVGEASTG